MEESRRGARLAGALLTVLGAISFSVGIAAMPLYYQAGGSVETVLIARYALVLVIAVLMIAVGRVSLRLSPAELLAALGSGVIFGVGGLSANAAYALIPLSLGVVIFYVYPLLTATIEAPLDRRLPSVAQTGCLIAALAGVAIALELGEVAADPRGMALSAMGALGVAASFVWSGRRLANAAPGAVFVYRSAAALFLTLGFALGSGSGVTGVSGAYAWSVFAVSVVFTSLAFMAMFAGVDRIGATPAAMIMNLEPAMTVALAAVVLGETMTPMKLIGGAIVVAAVLVSQVAGLRGEVKGVVGKPRLHGKPPPRVGPGTSRAR